MSDKHPPQQTVSRSEAGAPEATILRGTSKATTPPLRGTPPYQEGSRKNSPPEKGEYPEGGRGLVPKLRFPEFREAGEWKIKLLGDVCQTYSGGTPTSTNKNYYGGHISFIRSAEIEKSSTALHLTQEGLQSSSAKMVDKGDILYALYGANSGEVAIAKIAGAINQAVLCLKSKGSNAFIFQFLSFNKNQIINKYIQGGQGNLSGEIVKSIEVPFPELKEQQKIADCLSSLDTLITAQTEKIDALKTHKKGLMQQLFPQDGETVPRLRFSEFREAGEWEAKTLGDIARITSGGTPNRAEPSYWGGSIPWVTTSLIDFNRIDRTEEFITAEGLANSSAKLFPAQTLLMAMYGQGKTRGKVALLGIESTTNQACAAITFNDEVDTNFAFQNLASRYDEIRKLSNEGGQENLSAGLIKSILLAHPCLAEQQKTADCLSSLDTLIAAETEKLDALKTHKKGLMQQLFPTVENEAGS